MGPETQLGGILSRTLALLLQNDGRFKKFLMTVYNGLTSDKAT